jgi:hypothetical protein
MLKLIQIAQLENWADSMAARSRLPYFVKSLVCVEIEPQKLRMPSGDAVGLPGFDGVVVHSTDDEKKSRFVPHGFSVWEMGTGSDFKRKANDDYRKRTHGELQIDRSQVDFVHFKQRRRPFLTGDQTGSEEFR